MKDRDKPKYETQIDLFCSSYGFIFSLFIVKALWYDRPVSFSFPLRKIRQLLMKRCYTLFCTKATSLAIHFCVTSLLLTFRKNLLDLSFLWYIWWCYQKHRREYDTKIIQSHIWALYYEDTFPAWCVSQKWKEFSIVQLISMILSI